MPMAWMHLNRIGGQVISAETISVYTPVKVGGVANRTSIDFDGVGTYDESMKAKEHHLAAMLEERLPALLEGTPVIVAYLYGSMATGQETPLSDVDVAVLTDRPLDDRARLSLEMSLADKLASLLAGRAADVRAAESLPLILKGRVITEGILVYCRDDFARVRFETSVRGRYFDFLPVYRRYQQENLARMRREAAHG